MDDENAGLDFVDNVDIAESVLDEGGESFPNVEVDHSLNGGVGRHQNETGNMVFGR